MMCAMVRPQNAALSRIQEEWFKASSHKLSSVSQVEDYLTSFNEMSHDLLLHVVNMADANVRQWLRARTASW